MKEFKKHRGHCRVSQSYNSSDGYRLGAWVNRQRAQIRNLPPEQKAKLDMLGFVWDPLALQWEDSFVRLQAFARENGHCKITAAYKTADGYGLGSWVRKQRRDYDTMDPDRRQRLEALTGWSWGVYSDQWEKGFSYLKQFSKREGHCRVPTTFKTDDDYPLGQWVAVQGRTKNSLAPDRRQRLEALPGWVWKVEK